MMKVQERSARSQLYDIYCKRWFLDIRNPHLGREKSSKQSYGSWVQKKQLKK